MKRLVTALQFSSLVICINKTQNKTLETLVIYALNIVHVTVFPMFISALHSTSCHHLMFSFLLLLQRTYPSILGAGYCFYEVLWNRLLSHKLSKQQSYLGTWDWIQAEESDRGKYKMHGQTDINQEKHKSNVQEKYS